MVAPTCRRESQTDCRSVDLSYCEHHICLHDEKHGYAVCCK